MRVKTHNGVASDACRCGDWLAHWQKASGLVPFFCSEVSCPRRADVGAHVQKVDCTDAEWYIVPLCSDHHERRNATLSIIDSAMLVPADPGKSCGRKRGAIIGA